MKRLTTTVARSARSALSWTRLLLAAGVVAVGCGQALDQQRSDDAGDGLAQLAQPLGASPGGALTGSFRAGHASIGAATIPLPDVEVWAQNVVSGVTSPHAKSDYNGRYYIARPAGNYKICWSKPGFTSACSAATFNLSTREVGTHILAANVATSRVLRGHVTLLDGSPCLVMDSFFGIELSAVAELLDGSNAVLNRAITNADGDFVLPFDAAGRTLRVSCGAISQTASADQAGTAGYNVTFKNSRPYIIPPTATISGVDARQGVAPGASVQLATTVTDPELDNLTNTWKVAPTAGTLSNVTATSATWQLPTIAGTYSAYFSAFDKKGGYATRRVDVRVNTDGNVWFSGTVHDTEKNPIKGAKVFIGDANTLSDGLGNFVLKVSQATVYLFNIEKPGYAELSKRLSAPATGQEYVLNSAFRTPIDPKVDNVISDLREDWLSPKKQLRYHRRGGRVFLPANSLNLNPPPVGQLYAYISTVDPITEDMPGDMGAVNRSNKSVYLITHGAVFIEIRDSKNTKYNLAAGQTAKVEIPIQDPILQNDPAVAAGIASWTFDVPSGNWVQLPAEGVRDGDHYTMVVSSFSTKNADIEKANPACVKVLLDPGVPHTLKGFINVEVAPNAPRRREVPLDDDTVTIYNLPPNTPYVIEVFDSGGVRLDDVTGASTGAPWGGTGVPPAGTVCGDTKTITTDFLGVPSTAFYRYLSFKGTGDASTTASYYNVIDPSGDRNNLKKFWITNHFGPDGSGGTRTFFINHNDLGFGRDMNCLQSGADVACWVTNYGTSDQSPGNFSKAQIANKATAGKTVAMEYSQVGGAGPRVVKFYVYNGGCSDAVAGCGGNSPLDVSANLDGAGEKFVPQLCNTCHGGSFSGVADMGASFREFDVHSYRDGTAGPKPSDPAFGLTNVLTQEAEFFTQNQIVLATNPAPAISELVGLFYPTAAPPFDANAVPCGWRASTAGAPCSGSFSGGTADVATEAVYHDVVAKACRTCHSAQRLDIDWATYKRFADNRGALGPGSGFGIAGLVCTSGVMPHAHITYLNFWRSVTPHGPDTLMNFSHAATNPNAPAWSALGSCTPP